MIRDPFPEFQSWALEGAPEIGALGERAHAEWIARGRTLLLELHIRHVRDVLSDLREGIEKDPELDESGRAVVRSVLDKFSAVIDEAVRTDADAAATETG